MWIQEKDVSEVLLNGFFGEGGIHRSSVFPYRGAQPEAAGRMQSRMAAHAAQHKTENVLKA